MKTQAELDAEAAEAAAAKAAEEAKKSKNQPAGQGGQGGDKKPIASLEDALKVIEDLRKENAGYRTKGKSQEDTLSNLTEQLSSIKKHLGIEEQIDPVEQVKGLSSENEALQDELALMQLARMHNVPVEADEFFRFKISKKFAELKEGEELSEEAINEVLEDVQKYSAFNVEKPNGNSSGVGGKGGSGDGKKPPAKHNPSQLSAEDFAKMNLTQKSQLFVSNRAEYDRLYKAAKDKRLF